MAWLIDQRHKKWGKIGKKRCENDEYKWRITEANYIVDYLYWHFMNKSQINMNIGRCMCVIWI